MKSLPLQRLKTLLRYSVCGMLLGAGLWGAAAAQVPAVADSAFTLEGLRTPATPAFTLLGIAPSAVEKPQTPRAFATHLADVLIQNRTLPADFGLEIAPYWLTSHPGLSFKEYYQPGLGQRILQHTTFSIATQSTFDETDLALGPLVGLGLRTVLFTGQAGPEAEAANNRFVLVQARQSFLEFLLFFLTDEDKQYNSITDLEAEIDLQINTFLSNPDLIQPPLEQAEVVINAAKADLLAQLEEARPEPNDAALKTFLREAEGRIEDHNNARLRKAALAFQAANQDRVGFTLSLATAIAWHFPDARVEGGAFARFGIWLSPMYSTGRFDWIGVVRYIQDEVFEARYGDLGVRLLYGLGPFEASVEGVYRAREVEATTRYALNLSYRVSNGLLLSGVFGRDFDGGVLGRDGNLLTQLGMNIGLGSRVQVKPGL